jgi:molybdopterin-binding protein
MIRIENITKRFKTFTLSDVSLEIAQGDYVVLLGDSGSGKSVFLEILIGMTASDQGSIWVDGKDLSKLPMNTRPFGMVFQDLALFPHLSVKENIAYALKSSNQSVEEITIKVNKLASQFEIMNLLDRYPDGLSGGEKQRVALARTLAKDPICLFLDEPLTALDARIRKEIKAVLRNLHRDGLTIIHVTHDYQEALGLATTIGIMEKGQLVKFGPTLDVLRNPVSPFMASFTGIRNFIPVKIEMDPTDGQIKAWTEQDIPLVFQTEKDHGHGYLIIPEDAIFLSPQPVVTSAANQLKGKIIDIINVHHGFEVVIDVGFLLYALLTADGIDRLQLTTGKAVFASFKASALRYINL